MLSGKKRPIEFLEKWVDLVISFRIPVILSVITAAVLCLLYTVNNLGMNTSTRDMLSADLQWRQNDLEMDRLFPQYTNNILIVIESGTPDKAYDAASKLAKKLYKEEQLFQSVYFPSGLDFFRQSSLLYLDVDELQDLADNLATIQPFLARLTDDQTLYGLFGMLDDAIQAKMDGEEIDLAPLLKRLNTAFTAVLDDQFHRLSWRALMTGDDEQKSVYREFILLQPHLDFAGLFPAEHAIDRIRELGQQLGLERENGVLLRLTGSAVLSHEEMHSVSAGMGLGVIIAFCMVAAILALGLRSGWLVLATLTTLIAGLIFTSAFATLTIGTLNLISVAFAILYIGLGVDFAIHYCLRYREQVLNGDNKTRALSTTTIYVGESLLLCAVTTAIGFYAFVPTDYHGVAELGLISGTGMFISFLVTLTFLPALLSCFPTDFAPHKDVHSTTLEWLAKLPLSHAGIIKTLTLVAAFISILLVPEIQFDHNTLKLQSQSNPSVQTYMDLLDDSDTSPWTGLHIAENAEQAALLDREISRLDVVDNVLWLNDFIPGKQEQKLAIINEMDLLLLGIMETVSTNPGNDKKNIEAIRNFNQSLETYITSANTAVYEKKLFTTINRFLGHLETLDIKQREIIMDKLEVTLLETFPGRMEELQEALSATRVTVENIPEIFKSRWLSEGMYRLEIYPRDNLSDNDHLRRFVRKVQTVIPDMTGAPVINLEAGDAVIKAFRLAFTYAFIAIIILLFLITRQKRDTLYIIAPLVLAILFTGAVSVILSIPLNFANIIALPMLLGIGVDSAIHILHRNRTSPPKDGILLATSSARAVVVSALTTILSIGNLAFSRHLGTASMGQLLVIGISMTLLCSLFILPSLLTGNAKSNNDK